MKQSEFQKLLEGNIIGESVEANVAEILKQFKEASKQDKEVLFYSLFQSTRYDVMEKLVDDRALNETELFNIALKCKLDDLRIGLDTDSIQNRVHMAALDQLDEERIPDFYSALVDLLFLDRQNKLQLPATETLQALYESLFVGGHGQALRKLHNFLGYYEGHEGKNSKELIDAVRADNQEEALKLISQGYYVYDFSKFDPWDDSGEKITDFFCRNNLHHPNYNLLAEYNNGYILLHWVATCGEMEAVKLLIAAGANVNAQNNNGTTLLKVAAMHGMNELVKLLIAAGADPNVRNIYKQVPLHNAAWVGNTEVVRLLIAAGTNVNAQDSIGLTTPLQYAARIGFIDVVKELLKSKELDLSVKNEEGKTAADVAATPETRHLIEANMRERRDRARILNDVGASSSGSLSSSTAIPTAVPSLQVNASAVQLPKQAAIDDNQHQRR